MNSEQGPVPFVDLVGQYSDIRTEIDAAIRRVLDQAAFVGGTEVGDFEQQFAAYLDADHCVGVGNGTDAIELILEALDLPPQSEVIVPANSFIASSEAVSRQGHRAVFADVDEILYTIDPSDVERRIGPRTRAILAVHLYGYPAPMGKLLALAEQHDLVVIEDAAQAHGAEIGGRRVGAIGVAGAFSFYPGKNLGAYGDGGAVVSRDYALASRIRRLANHGRVKKYEHEFEGRNTRLDTLQAAVLLVKLRHLDAWTEHRRRLASLYRAGLAGVGDLVLPEEEAAHKHVYHLYVVQTSHRDALRAWLSEKQISTGIHYPVALPRLPAYADHPQHGECPVANRLANRVLSLPMGDHITEFQVGRVTEAIRSYFAKSS